MKVKDILGKSDKTLLSFELLPPLKGGDIGKVYGAIEPLMEFSPSFINLTYHRDEDIIRQRPDGTLERLTITKRPGTVALAAAIMKRYDVEVVPHLVCGGLDARTIENILIDLNFLDIDNIMALRGDPIPGQKSYTTSQGEHTYCSDLVRQISNMNNGVYLDGIPQNAIATDFCIGVAGYPEKHYESPSMFQDISNLKRKIEAGADFIVTQMFFDNAHFFDFVTRCRAEGITTPIIPGLKPVSSLKHLEMLPRTFHIAMPEALTAELSKCKTDQQVKEVGINWAIQQSKSLKQASVPAIHYYTMSRSENICEILKQVF